MHDILKSFLSTFRNNTHNLGVYIFSYDHFFISQTWEFSYFQRNYILATIISELQVELAYRIRIEFNQNRFWSLFRTFCRWVGVIYINCLRNCRNWNKWFGSPILGLGLNPAWEPIGVNKEHMKCLIHSLGTVFEESFRTVRIKFPLTGILEIVLHGLEIPRPYLGKPLMKCHKTFKRIL